MLALALLLTVALIMWAGNALLLRLSGQPVGLRVTASGLSPKLRQVNRVIMNAAILGALLVYPLLRGMTPWRHYGGLLPNDDRMWHAVFGLGAALWFLGLMYLAWTASGNVRFSLRRSWPRTIRRLLTVPLSAAFGALIEELLFRGMLLADLLAWLPTGPAVVIGATCFAAAHYVRRVKRTWTFPAHLALGMMLCLTFVWTGSLWLGLGLHAGGILMTLGPRPFIRYTGPAWLVGESVFPYAGVVGVAALVVLTLTMGATYGGLR